MDLIKILLALLFSDVGVVFLVELILVCIYVISCMNRFSIPADVRRGPKSSKIISGVASLVVSVVFGQLLGFLDFQYSAVLFLLDIWIVVDLCMINQWSQSELIGFISEFRKRTNLPD